MWAKILRTFLIFYIPILLITLIWSAFEKNKQLESLKVLEERSARYRKALITDLFQRLVYNLEYWSKIKYPLGEKSEQSDTLFMKPYYDIMNGISFYDQFRLIDLKGKEILRYERDSNSTNLIEGELQDKSKRDYFIDGLKLKKGEIYLSQINLNRENEKIEKPYLPVVRGMTPIFDNSKNQIGFVIINFDMTNILDHLEEKITSSNFYLIDDKLNIITSNTSKIRMPFELVRTTESDTIFKLDAEGLRIFKDTSFIDSGNLWSLNRLDATEGFRSFRTNYISESKIITPVQWAIVHQMPPALLNEKLWPIYRSFLIINVLALLSILVSSYFIIRKRLDKERFFKILQANNEKLMLAENTLLQRNKKITTINKRLEIRNKQLEEFNYMVSHNLRAPITSMSLVVDLIKEAENTNELNNLIPKLDQVTKSISEITEDIREYVTILNKSKVDVENLEIKPLIEMIKSEFSEVLLEEIEFEVKYDFEAWQNLHFSKFYFKSIIQNLMSNAIKYRQEGVKSYLLFETAWEENSKILYIKDNGRGINLDRYREDIFKLYKRFHRDVSGKGMGLFLVKSQLESMDAEITVKSVVNEGSTFKISFKNESEI